MKDKDQDRRPNFVTARLRSFGYAWRGIVWLVLTQGNALVHLAATVAVAAAGFYFKVSAGEWLALVLAMSTVWLAEGLNTAIEALADRITTERDPLIGRAKDVAAGAVLIAAIAAAIVGGIVFWPRAAVLLGY